MSADFVQQNLSRRVLVPELTVNLLAVSLQRSTDVQIEHLALLDCH